MAMSIDRINHAYLQSNTKKSKNNNMQSISFGKKLPLIPEAKPRSFEGLMAQLASIKDAMQNQPKKGGPNWRYLNFIRETSKRNHDVDLPTD